MQLVMLEGVVVRALGGFYFVYGDNKEYRCYLRGKIKRDMKVLVGDYVLVEVLNEQEAVIEKVLPRKNWLLRPPIANIAQGVVIMSLTTPPFNANLLNRLLVLIQAAGLKPVICLHKVDLVTNETVEEKISTYQDAGFIVFATSIKSGAGIEQLRTALKDKTSVFAGPSGAGKSSLLNRLEPGLSLQTGEVSKKLRRGRHTTTHVQLLPLTGGGWVADTPGFTTLDLVGITQRELMYYFPEFISCATECRFNPCLHRHEPNCAVKEAVEAGKIKEERYIHYLEFLQELEA
ncbi:MAG: ribosome small subunit-dependent GTPase A [bacterium]|jgi:ribosome biogenesis GTPase